MATTLSPGGEQVFGFLDLEKNRLNNRDVEVLKALLCAFNQCLEWTPKRNGTLTCNFITACVVANWSGTCAQQATLHAIRQANPDLELLVVGTSQDEDARITAFESGADHYMWERCSIREMAARIEAMARRSRNAETPINVGELKIWPQSRLVIRNGRTIKLSEKELDILVYLGKNSVGPVSRMDIIKNVFHCDFDPGTNIVEVHIHRLRQKIDNSHETKLVNTVRGEGYILGAVQQSRASVYKRIRQSIAVSLFASPGLLVAENVPWLAVPFI